MLSHWKALKLSSNESQTPPLLVKFEFGSSHYKIYLSDLTYIWTESLERKQIVKRALNVDTSIDPTESADQLQLLLQNIQKALDEAEGATLALSKSGLSQQLILRTSTPLPGALKPLLWPFHFILAPQHLLTSELLQPCLNHQFIAQAQISSLKQLIRDKDHVISRFTDKIQSDGTDLSKIFPGASSLRSGAKSHFRKSASKFVKGLGEFDDEEWRNCFRDNTQFPSDLYEIFSQVFFSDLENFPEPNIKNNDGTWWQNLRNEDSQKSNALNIPDLNAFRRTQSPAHLARGSREFENRGSDDAGFQKGRFVASISKTAHNQTLPPETHLTEATPDNLAPTYSIHGDTTTDDSDGDLISGVLTNNARKNEAPLSPDTLSRSSNAGETESRTFKGEDSMNHKFKPENPVISFQKPKQIDQEKKNKEICSGSDDIDDVPVPKSKKKLGKIGGNINLMKSDDPNEHKNPPLESKSIPSRDRRTIAPLDTEDKANFSLPSDSDLPRKKRASIPEKSPSPQRETSQERADHRREQLKRVLEATSGTAIKKKRKF